jgi:hypothetical protein
MSDRPVVAGVGVDVVPLCVVEPVRVGAMGARRRIEVTAVGQGRASVQSDGDDQKKEWEGKFHREMGANSQTHVNALEPVISGAVTGESGITGVILRGNGLFTDYRLLVSDYQFPCNRVKKHCPNASAEYPKRPFLYDYRYQT